MPSPTTSSRRRMRPVPSSPPVPEDYGEKAKLERLRYTSVTEMLAERFHMDEAYLKALNPGPISAARRHHHQGRQFRPARLDAGRAHRRRQGQEAGPRL
ncbi:MAG: hypothetical protein NVV72_11560 [Asticcacaulis sp.]|nr:hypothetical protein [Asticcacaulis sp.]